MDDALRVLTMDKKFSASLTWPESGVRASDVPPATHIKEASVRFVQAPSADAGKISYQHIASGLIFNAAEQ